MTDDNMPVTDSPAAADSRGEVSAQGPSNAGGGAAEPGDAAVSASAGRANGHRGAMGGLRWLLRGALLLSCVVSVALLVALTFLTTGGAPSAGRAYGTVVTLIEGNSYGEAVVYVGPQQKGAELTNDGAIREAVAVALQSGSSSDVLLRVSGGVSQREVERVRRLVGEAARDQKQVGVSMTLLTRK